MTSWILAGLGLGVVGSLHCLGMCGPLALALPGQSRPPARYVAGRVLYNLGRVCTYAALGIVVGLLGRAVSLGGAQQGLSIGIGALMILTALVPWVHRRLKGTARSVSAWSARLIGSFQSLFRRQDLASLFAIGLLNGLLPCGMVYAALGTATTTDGIGASVAFMAAFGVGTMASMLPTSLAGVAVSPERRQMLARIVPWALVVVGVLLILRGFHISPWKLLQDVFFLSPGATPHSHPGM